MNTAAHIFAPDECIAALASADGGLTAVIRVSGQNMTPLMLAAGITLPPKTWTSTPQNWALHHCPQLDSIIPCHVFYTRAPHSFTGFDTIEITIPGSKIIISACLAQLAAAGIHDATPGAFTRQALCNRRLQLDQAEGILAMTQAADVHAAHEALQRLRGALSHDIEPLRQELIMLRARVEAGLDFLEEDDVHAYDRDHLRSVLQRIAELVTRWTRAVHSVGSDCMVCLVGHSNAGKSALFHALTGADVIISPQLGTTRDYVEVNWNCGGRTVRMVDTAGYLEHCDNRLDQDAIRAGQQLIASAQLIIACSAPDAPLRDSDLAALPSDRLLICACKSDLGHIDERALIAVSVYDNGSGIQQLAGLIQERLGLAASGDARQQKHLAAVQETIHSLDAYWPDDDLLADDLLHICQHLGDIIGVTSPDDVLDYIFARFCIGK